MIHIHTYTMYLGFSPTYPWKRPLTLHQRFLEKFVSFWGFGEVWGIFPGYVGKFIECIYTYYWYFYFINSSHMTYLLYPIVIIWYLELSVGFLSLQVSHRCLWTLVKSKQSSWRCSWKTWLWGNPVKVYGRLWWQGYFGWSWVGDGGDMWWWSKSWRQSEESLELSFNSKGWFRRPWNLPKVNCFWVNDL